MRVPVSRFHSLCNVMTQDFSDQLASLNPPQYEAATHKDGPLLILAGAGSGKTRVITHRIAHLVLQRQVYPEQILAVTFTNKAASEMRERVDLLMDDAGKGHMAQGITISTFHSLGAKLLRRHANRLGLSWSFNIYDDKDQQRILKQLARQKDVDDVASYVRRMRGYIERMKNRGLTPPQAHEQAYNSEEEENAFFYEDYQKALRQANCVDFGDLLMAVLEIFRADPDLASSYSRQWRYVMVDEFQDTNPAQYELLRFLTSEHANLCVVGDDDQAIYRWRGATIANIMGFEGDYPKTTMVKLEQNYRSTQVILDAADDVIRHNPSRRDKKLWTAKDGGEPIVCFTATDGREEAVYVAEKIQLLRHRGSKLRDIAVFFRTNAQARLFEEQLRFAALPYQIVGGMSFYQREEIKDLLAYLKVALNPENGVDLVRVINKPSRSVGDSTVAKLEAAAKVPGMGTVYDVLRFLTGADMTFDGDLKLIEPDPQNADEDMALEALESIRPAQIRGLKDFLESLEALRDDLLHYDKLSQVVREFLERIHYLSYLEAKHQESFEDKAHNVGELLSAMEEFEQDFDPDEGTFLEEDMIERSESMLADAPAVRKLRMFLDRSALIQSVTDSEEPSTTDGAVTLMTVHGSKGLEFEHVFLAGMEDELFPSIRDRFDPEEEYEERRLAYVAITRARETLTVTNAKRRRVYGQYKDNTPSRFVLDIDAGRIKIDPKSVERKVDWKPRFNKRDAFKKRIVPPEEALYAQQPAETTWHEVDQTVELQAHVADIPEGFDEYAQIPQEEAHWSLDEDADGFGDVDEEHELAGKTVIHKRFGIGRVKSASGKGDQASLVVNFPTNGEKTIVRKFLKVL